MIRSADLRTKPRAPAHPLDPLTLEEIERTVAIVTHERGWGDDVRFVDIHLDEPEKSQVLAWTPGGPMPRRAFAVVLIRTTGETWQAIVDLNEGGVAEWRRVPVESAPFGQCAVMVEDFFLAEAIVKRDPAWRAALARRGLSEDQIDLVQVDPFSAGYFGDAEEQGRRLVRAVAYMRDRPVSNGYARPIEGVVAVVDLIGERVLRLVDDDALTPIPQRSLDYDPSALPTPRTDLKPLHIIQPEGPSFIVEGWNVRWQNWSFRVGFTPREGLVLHQISLTDGERARPIIYRASVTEMVVPYADPGVNHYWKSAFDAGEYGLGRLANQLALGCDCLGLIHYFDVPSHDDHGRPVTMKNAICMHEEDYGILWKHADMRSGVEAVRRSRRLVVSFFATVGNYDYGFYWYFYQDGTIQLEAKLTGIIQTAAVASGADYPWGGMVGENLGGPTHQHFFSARLHMMVDGDGNSVTEHEFQPRPFGPDNPHGNVFDVTSRTLRTEQEAIRMADGQTGRYWKVVNPNRKNSVGKAPGYKLIAQASPLLMAQPGSHVRNRGAFATHHLWVTPYAPNERYASGDYPNQHAGGDGVAAYAAQDRPIDNADLVLWHSFGHTHVCKPEDFPIMPVEYAGFMLKPNGFFSANPAMDLPADPDRGSRQSTACCSSDG